MIVPDVNVLVHGFREDSPHFHRCSGWLEDVVNGPDDLGLAEFVLLGVVRIVTNPRVFVKPTAPADALQFIRALREAPRARRVAATPRTWTLLTELVEGDAQIRGNLVPDAWLAALTLSHGAHLATADRGFARYPGLALIDPTRPEPSAR